MAPMSCSWLPPSKSVRPTEPWKRTSPVKTAPGALTQMLPGVWPGVCSALRVREPISIVSPCSR